MKAMENADHSVKEKVKDFVQQFHEARKVICQLIYGILIRYKEIGLLF